MRDNKRVGDTEEKTSLPRKLLGYFLKLTEWLAKGRKGQTPCRQ